MLSIIKKRATVLIYLVVIAITALILYSCEKDETISLPIITAKEVAEITQTTAIAGGRISDDGGSSIIARGVCWSTQNNPTINDNKTTTGTGKGDFSSTLLGLEPNSSYYVRAFASNKAGTSYSKELVFTTSKAIKLPKLLDVEISGVSEDQAVASCCIIDDGGAPIIARGICWSDTEELPTIHDQKTVNDSGENCFNSDIDNLNPNTTYYIRSYATNSEGTSYSKEISFTTLIQKELPTVTTTDASKITQTAAVLGGEITSDGGASLTSRGVCWSTSKAPTIKDNKTENGKDIGKFTSSISELTSNTTYYARAYATNSEGTSYGDEVSFTTLIQKELPNVTTTEASKITQTAAVLGGEITSDGGASVTSRGVCWSTSKAPTIKDNKTENGKDIGKFTSSVSELTPNTTYYARAYATNSEGTSYGKEVSFTTLIKKEQPNVTTTEASKITQTSAVLGGEITSDGGATVTSRGVCWSTSKAPTIKDNKTENGKDIGKFTSSVSELTPNTTYYARAYATNSEGTSYGDEVSFTTLIQKELPIVTTTEASKITQTSAVLGGEITSDGGASVTSRGVCWSTSKAPTIQDNKTENGKDIGKFTSSISELTPNTTYYARAYATNSEGTSYGKEVSFTTLIEVELPTVITSEITRITQTSAISGGDITNEGGVPVTERGICWNTKKTPTVNNNKIANGTGKGSYASNLENLTPNTTYFVRAYAINNVGISYGNEVTFNTDKQIIDNTVKDADGNVYETVTIGNQVWLSDNLRTTKYNDGTSIPLITDNNTWQSLSTPAMCWYMNDEATHSETYGALYNFHTVKTEKLCPEGWHVATDSEWSELSSYLGGDKKAGGKLKEKGETNWQSPNIDATNETGFDATAGGLRMSDGNFSNLKLSVFWWSSTEFSHKNGWVRDIFYLAGNLSRYNANKNWGCSVRCVKDK